MLRRTLAALALATTLAPSLACTTVIIAATSAPADTGEIEPDTTGEPTREDTDTSTGDTTGEPASSTGTTDETTGEPASTSTGPGPDSSSTGEPADTDTSTSTGTGETTGEDSSSGSSGSSTGTTGEPAPSKGLGEDCADDSECAAPGWCSNNAFDQDAPQACTLPCDPSMPDACTVGVCIDTGGNNHRCSGAWPVKAYKIVSVPYQGDALLPAIDKPSKPIVAYYVDPQPVAIKLQVSAVNNPGYGPAKVDAYAADGSPLGTASPGAPLIINPTSSYLILVLQATSDLQSLANVSLSNA